MIELRDKRKIFIMQLSMLCNNDIVVAKHIFFYQVCWSVIDRSYQKI